MIFNLMLCLLVVVIYLLTHISKKEQQKSDNLFLIVTFIVLFFLVAFREMTRGNDTLSYLNLYKQCGIYKWDILKHNSYYETGYLSLNIILNYISKNTRFFMIFMSFVFNYAVYKFIKDNSNNYLLSVFMYIGLLFFYQSMTMMRQFFALSIILLSFRFVKEKKLLKYTIAVVIASCFHSTAWIALFIYPIYHLPYNRKRALIILSSSIVALVFLEKFFPWILSIFGRDTYYSNMIGEAKLGNFLSSLVFIVMYCFSLFIIPQKERVKYGFYLYVLLLAASIDIVAINMAVLSRASQYYSILSIIALPNIIHFNVKFGKMLVEIIIVFFVLLYSSTIIIYKPEWNSAYNYKSCIVEKPGYICEF